MNRPENPLLESLSALMDGETQDFETRRVLREMEFDDTLVSKWRRYHLASGLMQGEKLAPSLDYVSGIRDALAVEPLHGGGALRRMAAPAGRFAIAASVAALAVLGVQHFNPTGFDQNESLQEQHLVTATRASDNRVDQQPEGPALQFPSGYQPAFQARTVSVGNNNRVSNYGSMPVLEVEQQPEPMYSEAELRAYLGEMIFQHSNNAALNNNQGAMPFARIGSARSDSNAE